MSSHYSDPKDFVLHISSELINEYLKKLHGVDFAIGDKKETREACADRFIDFMYKQSEDLRNKVFMELEYVNSLSSENHISALCNSSPDINREDDIEKRAKTYDERVDNWLEVAERGFNFAEKASTVFADIEDPNTLEAKKEIFATLGSDLILKDRKLFISWDKLLFPIKSMALEVREIKERLEPTKKPINAKDMGEIYSHNPRLLASTV